MLAWLAWPLALTVQDALGAPQASAPSLARAFRFTLGFALLSVSLELVFGLAVGLALARPLRFSWLWRACLLLPWAVPTVVSAKAWAWMFNYQLGLINLLLLQAGLLDEGINWFMRAGTAWGALLAVELWKTVPLVALLVMAGRQQISQTAYEAAALDGAGDWRRFWHVTLPQLRPWLVVAALFRMVDALRIFDSVWVLTAGGPAGATESLSLAAYRLYFQMGDAAAGARASLWTGAAILCVAAALVLLGKFGEDLKERD
jgi:multiple sugar transport system permease protein